MVAKKRTNAEVELAVTTVYGLITKGFSTTEIHRYCADNLKVGPRQADTYIQRARQLIVEDANLSRPAFLAEVLAKTGKIYQMAEKKGQLQTMLNALRFACELTGIVK